MSGDVTQNKVCADGGDLIKPSLPELALDIVLLGEAKTAKGL